MKKQGSTASGKNSEKAKAAKAAVVSNIVVLVQSKKGKRRYIDKQHQTTATPKLGWDKKHHQLGKR